MPKNPLSSFTKKQLSILIGVIAVLIIIGFVFYLISLRRPIPVIEEEKPPAIEVPEALKPGEIGEPEKPIEPEKETKKPKEEKPITQPLPSFAQLPLIISDTTGTIKEIKKDRLIVLGSGSNFSDQKPRELTLILTDSTITFEPGQKTKYQGLEGLKHLKVGGQITISSSENIRGKTEFIVKYINKILTN